MKHWPYKDRPHLNALKSALRKDARRSDAFIQKERAKLHAAIEQAQARATFETKATPKNRIAWAAAAAVLIGLSTLFFLTNAPKEQTRQSLTGLLYLNKNTIDGPKQFRVDENRGAKMVFPDQTALWLRNGANVDIDTEENGHVGMRAGALLASVTPQGSGHFVIETPKGEVQVHGTIFSVWVQSSGVRVRLHDGIVSFRNRHGQVELKPGEELFVSGANRPAVTPIDDAGLLQDLMIAAPSADLEGPPVPLIGKNIEMSPLNITATRRTEPSTLAPSSNIRRIVKRRPAVKPETAPASPPDAGISFTDPELLAIEVTHRARPDFEQQLELLMRDGRYSACIALADDALKTNIKQEEKARILYLKGYCEMRSGNLKKGKAAFENYLIRFPNGRHQKRVQEILGE